MRAATALFKKEFRKIKTLKRVKRRTTQKRPEANAK